MDVTYTSEELQDYLIENSLYSPEESLELQAIYHGFKWGNEIQRYLPF